MFFTSELKTEKLPAKVVGMKPHLTYRSMNGFYPQGAAEVSDVVRLSVCLFFFFFF